MKKIIYIILFSLLLIPNIIFASEKNLNLYLFYGDGCPHCKDLKAYLNDYLEDKPNIKLYQYEVWYSEENLELLYGVMNVLNDNSNGIPYLVIGENVITGYGGEYTNEVIENNINYYLNTPFEDKVGIYLGIVEEQEKIEDETINKQEKNEKIEEIALPSNIKKILKKSPLFISTLLIGLVDGFNPCAMWILLLLISMLFGIKDNKRKWILGITFILATGAVYFLFLMSWINLSSLINKIIYIRLAIASIVLLLGFISIIKFVRSLFKDTGCEVVNKKNRRKIIATITKIIKEKSFVLAILGIIVLAGAVNIIELLCSIGLPAAFAQVLAMNDISKKMTIIYSLIYVLAFLIDDILVFIISMKTMEIKAISNKYSKYSALIGGLVMILIGILMLYKPNWLMLNF